MMKQISKVGLNSATMYLASIISVALSVGTWVIRRSENRESAERLAIFVGLWAPTLMIMGKAIEDAEREEAEAGKVQA
jgi:hypothetical protein